MILRLAYFGQPSKTITSSNCFPFALCIFMTTTPVSGFVFVAEVISDERLPDDFQSVGVSARVSPVLGQRLAKLRSSLQQTDVPNLSSDLRQTTAFRIGEVPSYFHPIRIRSTGKHQARQTEICGLHRQKHAIFPNTFPFRPAVSCIRVRAKNSRSFLKAGLRWRVSALPLEIAGYQPYKFGRTELITLALQRVRNDLCSKDGCFHIDDSVVLDSRKIGQRVTECIGDQSRHAFGRHKHRK